MERLGTGIGWRPEIADAVERMPGIDWVEAVAENVCPGHLPDSLRRLRERGVTVVPHGVSLGLGGADRPDAGRLTALAERAEALGSPLVTEHIAFVRAGGPLTASPHLEAGHLLPVPRTRDALDVLCENIRIAQDALPVPLAVENIAALIGWPGEEMTEGQFLYEVADRTGVRLLIDVANLHTNHVNRGEDPSKALSELPLEAIAYVHVAGGFERDGVWHDSHAHPVPRPVLDILTDLASRVSPPGVLLERDENFPAPAELERELSTIRRALEAGAVERVKAELRAAAGTASGGRGGELFAAAGAGRREAAGGVGGGHLVQTGAVRQEGARGVTGGAGSGTGAVRPGDETGAAGATRPGDETGGPAATRSGDATGAARAIRPGNETGAAGATRPADETGAAGAIRPGDETGAAGATRGAFGRPHQEDVDGARQRLALAQAALLSALVAGTPVPEGFDRVRVGVQARALAAKRADVVAKVAPELPVILGDGYRTAFLGYAQTHPMTSGYRRDALSFAEHLLSAGRPGDTRARRELREWWLERSGPAPRSRRPAHRLALATRRVLSRR
ncbi:multinuclear nonheme iron-dependent oxidase [Streptomyces collinus]|uniref:multinuclear nonheme iron-dependent oxidase n=1 Tax=Streptomyces collinus TaxID=42684 RepID=UPI0037CDCD44